jgi:hypothetical protein
MPKDHQITSVERPSNSYIKWPPNNNVKRALNNNVKGSLSSECQETNKGQCEQHHWNITKHQMLKQYKQQCQKTTE